MAAKIPYVDQDECVACESCVELLPGVFRIDESGEKAEVHTPDGATEEEIMEAMDNCPAECIHWK